MALMNCPKCGRQISDKATKCVHCNYELVKIEKRCPECQEIINEDIEICPKCGCPINGSANNELQKVEVIKVRVNSKKIIIICIVALMAICTVVGVIIGAKNIMIKKQKIYTLNRLMIMRIIIGKFLAKFFQVLLMRNLVVIL